MVYNYKYKMEWVGMKNADASEFYYRLEFYKNEDIAVTYDVITLQASNSPFTLNYKANSDYVFEPFRTSFAEINLLLDENSLVEPIDFFSNSDDITFKVKLKLINVTGATETDLWQGYVLNDDIQYEWQDTYYMRMSAIDNLAILKKYEYSDPTTFSMYLDADVYTGISVKDFIVRCLGYSGNELDIKFDIRRKFSVDLIDKTEESIFINEYSAIDWKSKKPKEIYKLLGDLLQAFGCILYQDNRDNTWTILSINSLGTEADNIIPMRKYDSDGVYIEDVNYDITGSIQRGGSFMWSDVNQIVTLRQSYNSVQMEYDYQRKNLLNNYGFFKDGLSSTTATDWDEIGTYPILTSYNQFDPYDKIKISNNSSDYTPDFFNYLRQQIFIDDAQKPDSSLPFSYQLYFQMDYDLSIKNASGNYGMISFGELDSAGNFNFIRDDGSWVTGTSPYATTFIGTYPFQSDSLALDSFRALSKIRLSTNPERFIVYLRPIVQTFPAASVSSQFDNIQLNFIPVGYATLNKIYYVTYNFGDNRRVGERNIKVIKGTQFHGGLNVYSVLTFEDVIMAKNEFDTLITDKYWYRPWETLDAEPTFRTFTNTTTSSILSFYRGVGRIFTGNVYAEQTPVEPIPFAFPMYVSIEGAINNEIVDETINAFESRVLADGGTVETTYCGADFIREFYQVPSYFFMHEASFDYYTNKTNVKLHENFTNTNEVFSNDFGTIRGVNSEIGSVGSTTGDTQTEEIGE